MRSFSYTGMGGTGGYKIESDPIKGLEAQRSRFNLEQERAMAPYQLGQARTSLQTSQFNLGQARQLAPYQLGQARLGLERGHFGFDQEKARAPWELRGLQAQTGMGELGLERGRYEFGEYKQGAGLRGQQQELSAMQAARDIARTKFESQYDPSINDVFRERPEQTRVRQYQMQRQAEDLEKLRMQVEQNKLQRQLQRQKLPSGLSSGGSTMRSPWMQNYQSPSFPRF